MNARWVDLRAIFALTIASCTTGCETTAFYGQAVAGHIALMHGREPVERVFATGGTDPALRSQLEGVREILSFARETLQLDTGKRYQSYVSLNREFVVWNIFATPEFAVEPFRWCYPLIGCAAYRGYFAEQKAQKSAARLAARGLDTSVSGAPAYSSLGWFDDPLISTFIRWDQPAVAALIFHELAHSKLFVSGDTRFNESFATFVEREGVRQWLANDPPQLARYERAWRDGDRLRATVLVWREQFKALYALPVPAFAKRYLKAELSATHADCVASRADAPGAAQLTRFVAAGPNNARFVPVSEYFEWVPAFTRLFADARADWSTFYSLTQAAARMEPAARRAMFDALASSGRVEEQAGEPIQSLLECGVVSHRVKE